MIDLLAENYVYDEELGKNRSVKGAMFREILEFKKERNIKDSSILQLIIEFCLETDSDPIEIGEILRKDKSFKETFKEDLKYNFEALFSDEIETKSKQEWF